MLLDIIIMDIIYKRKYSAIPGQVPMDTWQDCVSDAVWASVRGRDYLLLLRCYRDIVAFMRDCGIIPSNYSLNGSMFRENELQW